MAIYKNESYRRIFTVQNSAFTEFFLALVCLSFTLKGQLPTFESNIKE